ncbi:MgtC/SapB family protein [Dokdonella sp.]|uniref:MgtC/SapB family protein n=1 Tax=Dokdonella sp. TaxID=2291710 RepID=UPI001B20328D|nr:MgtC/SapB family protein [Dokdonella sp.]MBO9662186.1 MgtC/SapB family protein [Dokdonella sp.]
MDLILQELGTGLPDFRHIGQAVIRIVAAIVLGAVIGWEREKARKPAGLRTHILVCLGTAVFVIACIGANFSTEGLSRVIQGIVTGLGFIGAGSILKLSAERDVRGLTTAAGIWMTAAIGVTVGLGCLGIALIATAATFVLLRLGLFAEDDHAAPPRDDTSGG